jgi:hypothetical protein
VKVVFIDVGVVDIIKAEGILLVTENVFQYVAAITISGTTKRDNRAKPINIFFGFIFSPEPTTFFGINNINLQIGAEVILGKIKYFF